MTKRIREGNSASASFSPVDTIPVAITKAKDAGGMLANERAIDVLPSLLSVLRELSGP
ncbi:hypothetical protein GCM10027027_23560 [Neomicrococcus lactis]